MTESRFPDTFQLPPPFGPKPLKLAPEQKQDKRGHIRRRGRDGWSPPSPARGTLPESGAQFLSDN
jgi:hypothetical protein